MPLPRIKTHFLSCPVRSTVTVLNAIQSLQQR